MAFNDPIAELLTKIRNAKSAQHRHVDLSKSKIKVKILDILKSHGFIENFLINDEQHKIRIFLRYNKRRESVINDLQRISRCGLRRYTRYTEIPKIFNGMGIAILTTSRGVMDGETARNMKVGGELLCKIW